MRIAFADFIRWDYTVESVRRIPMGGSQSAACYLSLELARLGHEIHYFNNTTTPGIYDGVNQHNWVGTELPDIHNLNADALIILQKPALGRMFKSTTDAPSRSGTRLILWATDAPDQVNVQSMHDPSVRDGFDGLALVSQWQADQYSHEFGVDLSRVGVMRNAISPAFANLFGENELILPQKSWPPILAYTSTPHRGLAVLLDLFPDIRARTPGVRLQVFSSMKIYQSTDADDRRKFGALYDRCRATEGVEYVGPLPQPQLAERMRHVSVLAYPCIYPETSCIAVMEAMAAGCRIVSTDLGALSETTGGFARLLSRDVDVASAQKLFVDWVVEGLEENHGEPNIAEDFLRKQVQFVHDRYLWSLRAGDWARWIPTLTCRPAPIQPPRQCDPRLERAAAHQKARRFPEAEADLRAAWADKPKDDDDLHQIGIIAWQIGLSDFAFEVFRRGVEIQPLSPPLRSGLGLVLAMRGQVDEAIAEFRHAIALSPDYAEAYNNLGNALQIKGEVDQAIDAFRKALSIRPAYPGACNNLAIALAEKEKWPEAIAAYKQAIALDPTYAAAYKNLAAAYRAAGSPEKAVAAAMEALALQPQMAEAWTNLGNAQNDLGRMSESIASHRNAVRLQPAQSAASFNLSTVLLRNGEFAEGWKLYESRWSLPKSSAGPGASDRSRLDLAAVAGKRILVTAEETFGDMIQFARYVPLLAKRGAKIILQCPAPLSTLFQSLQGVECLLGPGESGPAVDFSCPLLSLPGLFGTTMQSIPGTTPYLSARPAAVKTWRDRLASRSGFKIGLRWSGRHRPGLDREVPLATLARLVEAGKISLFALQKVDAELAGPAGTQSLDLSIDLTDFAQTAALMESLDLVITVDTATAHLAGALGRPTWMLLPFASDWRWLLDRDDSPWYPTMRLFRQTKAGDWTSPIEKLTDALRKRVAI